MDNNKLQVPYNPDPTPKDKPSKLLTPGELGIIIPEEGMSGVRQSYKFDDYAFIPKPNMDNNLYRAQRQKWYQELGLTVGNLLPNIGLGIVESLGYVGTLFESGEERDYSNALTELAQRYKNPLGEVYRENPDKVIDWSDSAWWFNTGGQLIESIGEFAVLGMGTGSVFKALAESAAWSARSLKVAKGAAQVLNAGLLSYVEGAMSGQQIYQRTYESKYQEFLREGASSTEADQMAKEVSAEAAARTVQLNTIMNTGLNLTILGPLFRSEENAMMKWFRTNKQQPGESLASYKSRLQMAMATDPAIRSQLGLRSKFMTFVGEPVQEGVEEINTQYAEDASGRSKKETLLEALTNFEGYLKAVTNEEGMLNFALGAIGGLGHVAVIDNVPIHHKNISGFNLEGKALDASGKDTEKKRWVSARTLNEYNTRSYFNNVKDALLKDVSWFEQKEAEMREAKAQKDTAREEQIRAEMIAVNHFNAVSMGLAENWKEQYKQIAALDNTKTLDEPVKKQLEELESELAKAMEQKDEEAIAALTEKKKELLKLSLDLQGTTEAIQKGYAEYAGDTRYQERAAEAVSDLSYLQTLFDDLQARYDTGEQQDKDLVDHLFYRKANHYLTGKSIEKQEAELNRMRMAWDQQQLVSGIRDTLMEQHKKLEDLKRVRTQLEKDLAAMRSEDEGVVKKLLERYKVTWLPGEPVEAPVKRLADKFAARSNEYKTRIDKAAQEIEEAATLWKQENPDRDLETMLQSFDGSLSGFIDVREAQLELVKQEHTIAGEFLQEIMRTDQLEKFRKGVKADRVKTTEGYSKALKAANDKILQDQLDKEAAAEVLRKVENQVQRESRKQSFREQKEALRARMQRVLSQLKVTQDKKKKKELREHLDVLRSYYNAVEAQLNEPAPVPETKKVTAEEVVEELTGEKPKAKPATSSVPKYNPEKPQKAYAILVSQLGEDGAIEWGLYLKRNYSAPFELLVRAFRTAYTQLTGKEVTQEWMESFYVPMLKAEVAKVKENPPSKTDMYMDMRSMVPRDVRDILDEVEVGEEEFDASRLLEQLKGKVNPETAIGIVSRMREMLSERGVLPEQSSTVTEKPEVPVAPIATQDTGDIVNYTMVNETSVQEINKSHSGKTVRDAIKVAYNSTPYDELQFSSQYGYLRYFDVLDENFNKDNLIPGGLVPGTQITFRVDTQWKGKINIDNALVADEFGNPVKREDAFANYVDADGKIGMQPSTTHADGAYANVPIQIVDTSTGNVLGYLHRVDWVTSKYPGSSTYQHIVDSYMEGEELVTNNVSAQARRLKVLRRTIVDSFNKGLPAPVSRITGRSTGSLFLNLDIKKETEKSKLARGLASTLLPDPELTLAYVAGVSGAVSVNIGDNEPFQHDIENIKQISDQFAGVPVSLHPTPGGYLAAPLFNKKLGDIPVAIHTIVRAIEIHLAQDKAMAAQVAEKTKTIDHPGFDLLTVAGLRGFLNQFYLHTTKFNEKDTMLPPSASVTGQAMERFMLDVEEALPGEPTGKIKMGESFSGAAPVYLRLNQSGKLMEDQAEWLQGRLAQQYFVVPYTKKEIRGLNHKGTLAEVQIRRDGTVHRIEHKGFNSYLKSKSETYVYGKHQVKGTYVYTANPVIYFDYEAVTVAKPATPPTPRIDVNDDDLNFFAGMRNGVILTNANTAVESMATPKKGEILSMELLEKLYNFTPEENRNGKLPGEVLVELSQKGIHTLAEGHNPFYKC